MIFLIAIIIIIVILVALQKPKTFIRPNPEYQEKLRKLKGMVCDISKGYCAIPILPSLTGRAYTEDKSIIYLPLNKTMEELQPMVIHELAHIISKDFDHSKSFEQHSPEFHKNFGVLLENARGKGYV